MNPKKSELLVEEIEHIDIKQHNVVALVDAMSKMAFSARDLGRAAQIYDAMLRDDECAIILCLAGSLISAGLKQVVVDLVRNNMVDAIVSTGQLNGAGNFGFLLTGNDGRVTGGGGVDKLRIKIWDINNQGSVVYDNAPGESDDLDSANPQPIGGGSIVIHR